MVRAGTEAAAQVPAWWDLLPEDFYLHPDHTDLDARHPLKVHGTAALDHLTRTGLATLMTAALLPASLLPGRLQLERELLSFYGGFAGADQAGRVFLRPPADVPVHERRPGALSWRPRGIPSRLLYFDSPFVPLHPQMVKAYRAHGRNRRAWAQHWTHADGPRPTLMFLHGFTADAYWFNSAMFSLPWLYRQGYDILLCILPFHGARRARLEPFSGFGYFAYGLASMNEAMLNAIHDLRVWMDYLERHGAPSIGVSGLSLGGYLSALLASVDDRLAYCIPNSPVVSPVDMAREWLPMRWMVNRVLRAGGMPIQELRRALALHSPLSYTPQIDAERLFIIGGAGDRFTPPRFVRLLHQHWKGSAMHWFPGNHVVHLHQRVYLELMRQFMDRHARPPVRA
ncbi:MAG: alpha/beta hydrolase family protein [Nevskia sp.]|nr:alpha/beta hydrolase family protein [Nevskia sp.]